MSRETHRAPVLRCLTVWSAVTAGTALVLSTLAGDLTGLREPAPTFDVLLTRVAAVALGVAAVWFWVVATVTAADAARGVVGAVTRPGCPAAVRRLVLAACGVALAAGVVPANAEAPTSVVGMPPQPVAVSAASLDAAEFTTVRAGDSLWSIAASRLDSPTDAETGREWRRIWAANRAVIGADPDLIHPGQQLILPDGER